MTAWPTWLCWLLGGLIAATGLMLFVWALLWDRSRGRPRCPQCWYDLAGQAPDEIVCPECGFHAHRPRQFFRTRRRWRAAAGGLGLVLVGIGVSLEPSSRGGHWHAWVPSTALIVALPWTDQTWPWEELDRRVEVSIPGLMWTRREALWDWQWCLLTRRCATTLDSATLSSIKFIALRHVLETVPNPAPVATAIARRLQDPDIKVRALAAWGIKAARYDWGPASGLLINALKAAPDDTDKWGHSNKALALESLERLEPLTAHEGPPPTPDEVVRVLTGAGTRELSDIHNRLGMFSRMLSWPYDGESGPFQVSRFDLEIDGTPGTDCVVRIEDASNTHGEMLLFLRRGEGWRCAGLVEVGNQTIRPPEPRSEAAPDGRAWLVIRECAGSDGSGAGYLLLQDVWLSVSDQGIRVALWTAIEGHRKGRARAGAPPVEWELKSDLPRIANGGTGLTLEYPATIRMTATWPDGWHGIPAATTLEPAAELFTKALALRFRWNQSKAEFKVEQGQSPWIGTDGVADALLGSSDEFLQAAAADLVPIAREPTPAQREWLNLYLNECSPSAARDELLRLLGPEPRGP